MVEGQTAKARAPRALDDATRTRLTAALADVEAEVERAMGIYGPMHSAHEAYAVVLEEVDELGESVGEDAMRPIRDALARLWWAVRMKQGDPARGPAMRGEAVQAAAMLVRMIVDVCDEPGADEREMAAAEPANDPFLADVCEGIRNRVQCGWSLGREHNGLRFTMLRPDGTTYASHWVLVDDLNRHDPASLAREFAAHALVWSAQLEGSARRRTDRP